MIGSGWWVLKGSTMSISIHRMVIGGESMEWVHVGVRLDTLTLVCKMLRIVDIIMVTVASAAIRSCTNQSNTIDDLSRIHQNSLKRSKVFKGDKGVSFLSIGHGNDVVPIDLNIHNTSITHEELSKQRFCWFDNLICLY